MIWLRLAIANLRLSPLTSLVNVLLMALGTASIVLLLLIGYQLSQALSRDARDIDLVLGAKGSPVQLILSSVYHSDIPPGNIEQQYADRWAKDPRVKKAVPLALGDSYRSHRIVGTTPDYIDLYNAELSDGRLWNAPMEAVLGAVAAQSTGHSSGAQFAGAHGLAGSSVPGAPQHASQPYRVVGTLKPTGTVIDRLILTSLHSVWSLHSEHANTDRAQSADTAAQQVVPDENHADSGHDHESEHDQHLSETADSHHGESYHTDNEHLQGGQPHADHAPEITAMLLQYKSPMAAISLPRQINAGPHVQAAAPAMEVSRILQLVGVGLDGLQAFAWILIITAALSVFSALYGSLQARRGDLAMLRCLGATRRELMQALLLEGLVLSGLGVILGFMVGHGVMELLSHWLSNARGMHLTGLTWAPGETLLLPGLFIAGAVAAAIPAVQAYRTDVASTLAKG